GQAFGRLTSLAPCGGLLLSHAVNARVATGSGVSKSADIPIAHGTGQNRPGRIQEGILVLEEIGLSDLCLEREPELAWIVCWRSDNRARQTSTQHRQGMVSAGGDYSYWRQIRRDYALSVKVISPRQDCAAL